MIRYDRVATKYFQFVLIFSASPSDRSDQFAQTRAEAGPGHTEVRGLETRYQAHGALQGGLLLRWQLEPTVHCCLWEEEALSHGVSIQETGPSFCTLSQLASQASQASKLLQSFCHEALRASHHSSELTEDFC